MKSSSGSVPPQKRNNSKPPVEGSAKTNNNNNNNNKQKRNENSNSNNNSNNKLLSDSLEGGGLSSSYERRTTRNNVTGNTNTPTVSWMAFVLVASSGIALLLALVVYGLMGGWQQHLLQNLYQGPQEMIIQGKSIRLQRGPQDRGGVIEIWADDESGLQMGLGYAHAIDRIVPLVLSRTVAQGRISELIVGEDKKALAIDTFMRKQSFYRAAVSAAEQTKKDDSNTFHLMEAYAMGVNHRLEEVFGGKAPTSNLSLLESIVAKIFPLAPFELSIVAGIKTVEPWTPADSLAIVNLMAYMGLAEMQEISELYLIEIIKKCEQELANPNGAHAEKWKKKEQALKAIFSPHLNQLFESPDILEAIRDVRLSSNRGIIPQSLWEIAYVQKRSKPEKHSGERVTEEMEDEYRSSAGIAGSNNWVLHKNFSDTQGALMASDPHLEINRLPAIWYEVVLHKSDNDFIVGITVPGVPGVIMGRTKHLTWSFTYGFMDMLDFFIEKCEGLSCKDGSGSSPVAVRRETILRKGSTPIEFLLHETSKGYLLEVNDTYVSPNGQIPDIESGLYLSRAYSHRRFNAGPATVKAILGISALRTVQQAQAMSKRVELSLNFLFGDADGNIAYQQSGLMPARPKQFSGLFPLLGWKPSQGWQEDPVSSDKFGSLFNPPEGFIATANDDAYTLQDPVSVNLHMGDYRRARVEDLLKLHIHGKSKTKTVGLEDMKSIQRDITSNQAKAYFEYLTPILEKFVDPKTRKLRETSLNPLKGWDLRYTSTSAGGALFEEFYSRLLADVFGNAFGDDLWNHMKDEFVFRSYFHFFDKIIFEHSPKYENIFWKSGETRDQLFERILLEMAKNQTLEDVRVRYEEAHSLEFSHILFEKRLPLLTRFLGYDLGPFSVSGGRATVVQFVQIPSKQRGRIAVGASWRHLSDMSDDGVTLTCLPGGPSDQIASEIYSADLKRWLTFRYKRLPRFEKFH